MKVRPNYEEKSGKTYDTFKGVSYTQQVVAGMNYKVKVSQVYIVLFHYIIASYLGLAYFFQVCT